MKRALKNIMKRTLKNVKRKLFLNELESKGFTLVEMIVTVALIGVVVTAIFSFFFFQTRTYTKGSDKSQIQSEIRLASDFISKELRYATKIAVSTPADASSYNRIYIQGNKLMFQPAGGTSIEKSSEIFDPTDLVVSLSGSNGNYTAKYSLLGTKNSSNFSISSSVNLKNVTNVNVENGNQVYYQMPVALSSTTTIVSPTPVISTSPSPSPVVTPTISATPSPSPTPIPTPTPIPIGLSFQPSSGIPTSIKKDTSTPEYTLTASGGDGSYTFAFANNGWATYSVGTQTNGKTLRLTAPTGNGKSMQFSIVITSGGISKTFGPYNTTTTN